MYTAEDLTNLEEAIRKLQNGERVVQVAHEGHAVKYAEVDLCDLLKLRDRVRVEVNGTGRNYKRRIQIISNKGVR